MTNLYSCPHSVWLVGEGWGWPCSHAGTVTTGDPTASPLVLPEPEIWAYPLMVSDLAVFSHCSFLRHWSQWRNPLSARPFTGVLDSRTWWWSSVGGPRS
ncbi:hypothetical protein FKM82_029954 [Ascaphus truei]